MTLSDRFEQMEAKRVNVKPVFNQGPSQRRVDVDSRRKVGRQTQFDARRQGMVNTKPAMRAAQSKVVSPRQQPPQQQRMQGRGRGRGVQAGGGRVQRTGGMPLRNNAQKPAGRGGAATGRGPGRGAGRTGSRQNNNPGGRGGGRSGRGGRGADKGGRGNNSKASTKPADNTNLDEGLDEYWFKAGKGPDPKVASLDRGLDSYWSKAAEKTNGDAAAGDDKMEDAGAETPAVPAVASVAGVDPDL